MAAEFKRDDAISPARNFLNLLYYFGNGNQLQRIRDETKGEEKEGKYRRDSSRFVIDKIEQFFPEVKSTATTDYQLIIDAIQQLFDPDDQNLGKALIQQLSLLYREALFQNKNTQAQRFSQLYHELAQKYAGKPAIFVVARKELKVAEDVRRDLRARADAKVYERNVNRIQVNDTRILEIINKLKTSQVTESKLIAVGLMTGARLIEILRRSFFVPYGTNAIRQIGVAKKKGDTWNRGVILSQQALERARAGERITLPEHKEPEKEVVKPILGATSDQVVELVSSIRTDMILLRKRGFGYLPDGTQPPPDTEQPPFTTNIELTNSVNKAVNAKIRRLFQNQALTFHSLRGIYAEFTFQLVAPREFSSNAWYAQVLGHRGDSLATSISYQKFSVKDNTTKDQLIEGLKEQLQEQKNVFARLSDEKKQLEEALREAKEEIKRLSAPREERKIPEPEQEPEQEQEQPFYEPPPEQKLEEKDEKDEKVEQMPEEKEEKKFRPPLVQLAQELLDKRLSLTYKNFKKFKDYQEIDRQEVQLFKAFSKQHYAYLTRERPHPDGGTKILVRKPNLPLNASTFLALKRELDDLRVDMTARGSWQKLGIKPAELRRLEAATGGRVLRKRKAPSQ